LTELMDHGENEVNDTGIDRGCSAAVSVPAREADCKTSDLPPLTIKAMQPPFPTNIHIRPGE
jgi:hypothetical protein